MSETKNLIITIALSTIVLLTWQYFYVNPQTEATQKIVQAERQASIVKEAMAPENQVQNRSNVLAESHGHRVHLSNPKLRGSINLQGARFDDLLLTDYHVSADQHGEKVVLFSPSNTKQSYFAEFGWVSSASHIVLPNAETLWHTDKDVLHSGETVTLSWANPQGLIFYILISLDDNYMFTITQKMHNTSTEAVSLSSYGLVNKVMAETASANSILHEGPIGVFKGILEEVTYNDLPIDEKREFKHNMVGDWIGISDKYWLTALVPDNHQHFAAEFLRSGKSNKSRFQVDYIGQAGTVNPGQLAETTVRLFSGAKKLSLLDHYAKEHHIKLFDRAVDFGWFYFLTKPMFTALQFFNTLLGNFGLAILLMTVLVKLVMFPLANKSYHSMNKMKELQPFMTNLKERCGDDKMKLNREIMDLYKREGVNPLSGCLPMLVQLPVFFSLYKVLFVTLEMRHAKFFGWISDLSAPDHTSIFNLFGLLPWSLPAFLMIGIWPIIMGITMYLQQKMNPEPTDPVQAQVMKFLPLIFVFMFGSFPAGLIIYWAWNNILSIMQQWFISKKAKPHASKFNK